MYWRFPHVDSPSGQIRYHQDHFLALKADIANMAVFLASDESRMVTGTRSIAELPLPDWSVVPTRFCSPAARGPRCRESGSAQKATSLISDPV
jgi:hypothetical protein